MDADDLAMVITFSDQARVVSNYSGDKRLLLQRIDAIAPTERTTSLREALQVAAGLANPSKQIGEGVVASRVVAPKLKIYTDGGFADVEGFSLGNLEPEVIVIGPPPTPFADPGDPSTGPEGGASEVKTKSRPSDQDPADNVAILALQTRRNDEKTELFQVFGRVHNYRGEPVSTEAQLWRLPIGEPGKTDAPTAPTLIDAIAPEDPSPVRPGLQVRPTRRPGSWRSRSG